MEIFLLYNIHLIKHAQIIRSIYSGLLPTLVNITTPINYRGSFEDSREAGTSLWYIEDLLCAALLSPPRDFFWILQHHCNLPQTSEYLNEGQKNNLSAENWKKIIFIGCFSCLSLRFMHFWSEKALSHWRKPDIKYLNQICLQNNLLLI